ncbi:MAG: type II methionyl aminopeptidase [Candidatus Altiarchaeota archaeon]
MDEVTLEKYRQAGRIAVEVRDWSVDLVKPGVKVLDLADQIEQRIIEKGGQWAFPTNVCLNDVAAHYAPKQNDESVVLKDDLVTIDLGVHIEGCIADTAHTIDLSGKYGNMINANKKALAAVIEEIKPGTSVQTLGEIVQSILKEEGFKPIENLTGHEVKEYDLHAGLSIPNIKVPYDWTIDEGMVLAIEPFATDGVGRVIESQKAEIYSLLERKPTRIREGRLLLKEIDSRQELPFAARWYAKKINPLRLNLALGELVKQKILRSYPILHEKEGGKVSQFEHTVIVTEDGCEVTTE